jgi:micrococcal nuclease
MLHPKSALAVIMTLAVLLAGLTTACASAPKFTPDANAADTFFDAQPWELPDDAEKMVVERVIDGDTVRLTKPNDDWWETYRLIGIQAPEMDGPYTDEQCYGPEAKEYLKELLPPGTEVYIQKDITDKDRNDRFLRHLFIIDDADDEDKRAFLVSEVLVLGGYAEARSYPPDDLYDDVLQDAQKIADEKDAGLWDACAA